MADVIYKPHDTAAIAQVTFSIVTNTSGEGDKIEFQFPPIVNSENKIPIWDEQYQSSYEPVAIWKGAQARTIDIEWHYVVYGSWDISRIKSQSQKLKEHMYILKGGATGGKAPFVRLKLYELGDKDTSSFRINTLNIRYSKERIKVEDKVYPLETTMSVSLKSFTNVQPVDLAGGDALQDIPGIRPFPTAPWY